MPIRIRTDPDALTGRTPLLTHPRGDAAPERAHLVLYPDGDVAIEAQGEGEDDAAGVRRWELSPLLGREDIRRLLDDPEVHRLLEDVLGGGHAGHDALFDLGGHLDAVYNEPATRGPTG